MSNTADDGGRDSGGVFELSDAERIALAASIEFVDKPWLAVQMLGERGWTEAEAGRYLDAISECLGESMGEVVEWREENGWI